VAQHVLELAEGMNELQGRLEKTEVRRRTTGWYAWLQQQKIA
jgi:hypothetical protein